MFTGYIDYCGWVAEIKNRRKGKQISFACPYFDLEIGESIAVDGVCLTVSACQGGQFTCDVSPETLKVTHMLNLQVGIAVHLERSLRVTDRLHGHFVMGHIDQVCQLEDKEEYHDFLACRFTGVRQEARQFLIPKGCITINGVSLTLNQIDDNAESFEVMLVPETLDRTNLAYVGIGEWVNVEYDYIAKVIKSPFSHSSTRHPERSEGSPPVAGDPSSQAPRDDVGKVGEGWGEGVRK